MPVRFPDRPVRNRENRCPAPGSHPRGPASAKDAHLGQMRFGSPRSIHNSGAARKRTSAFPENLFPIPLANARVSASEFLPPEKQGPRRVRRVVSCEDRREISQTLRVWRVSLSGQTASSAWDRKDQGLTPEQMYRWRPPKLDAADSPPA